MSPKTIRGFAVCYALLFLVLIGAGLGAYATYNLHGVKKTVARVQSALGATDVVKAAEKNVAGAAVQQGLTITKQTVTRVVEDPKDPNTVVVYDTIRTVEAGVIKLKVTLTKGVWSVSNIAVA